MNIFHKNCSGGFTLIEIIVVIVLIAIIAFVAVPQMSNTVRAKRLYDAVEKLNDDLNYCRDYAISQHTNTWVRFRIAQNRYRMFYGDSWGSRVRLIDPARNSTAWFTISNDFPGVSLQSVSFRRRRVSFDWWGTPSEGGTAVLTNGLNTHTTTVNAETGYVQR